MTDFDSFNHRTTTSDHDTPRHRGTEDYQHDPLTHRVIGCAMEVHRQLGPGLLEVTYETALCLELTEEGIPFVRQTGVPVYYKGSTSTTKSCERESGV